MGKDDDEVAHRLRGAIDGDVLFTIRDVFDRHTPLATTTVDDRVNPSVLMVELTAGLQEDTTGRFDIQWTTEGDYKCHYTEKELDFRWGHHPHGEEYNVRGYAHFHPPPDASRDPNDVKESCFTVHRPKLIARGIIGNWRVAYHNGLKELNRPEYTG